ncbi:MAG: DUF512 domain-containing protein [Tissierellia bacterium]|nr:DUF512 domain-containing protein [Tissierellia bacterium]
MNPYERPESIPGYSALRGIRDIRPDSIAQELGLEPGDEVLAINGDPIGDVIDYQYHVGGSELSLHIRHRGGEEIIYDIEKDLGEDLGLIFEDPLLDRERTCKNKCLFCFIDQMPPGMRESLYIKDDDSRLSFLQGNYITLTNVSEEDFQRMVDYKLSPINVSVHTTNPELRRGLLKHPNSGKILEQMTRLAEAGITMNAQIVAVPGINDGKELVRTLEELSQLYPQVASVAIVPVGLTKYRDHLPELSPFDETTSAELIDLVEAFAATMMEAHGTHFAYPSDEFYLMADRPLPPEEFYDGYPQYENGVGLLRSFAQEFFPALEKEGPLEGVGLTEITLATGAYAAELFEKVAEAVGQKWPQIHITVRTIENEFFGTMVKVAGLITGKDLLAQLKGHGASDIIIPRVMLRHDKLITLDDYSLEDLEDQLEVSVTPMENDGEVFLKQLKEVIHGG